MLKPPNEMPDIDEAAKYFVIGMIVDGVPKSITLSNDTVLEYWPPVEGSEQHMLNLKIFGRNRGLGMRQLAIAENAIAAALKFFGIDEKYIDYGANGGIYDEIKSHSYGFNMAKQGA